MCCALIDAQAHVFTDQHDESLLLAVAALAGWAGVCARLQARQVLSVAVPDNRGIGGAGAQAIARHCGAVRVLRIGDGNGIGEAGARAIAANCRALTSLTIGNGNNIGEGGARAIAEHCPALRFFSAGDGVRAPEKEAYVAVLWQRVAQKWSDMVWDRVTEIAHGRH